MENIESEEFNVLGKQVTFKLSLLPFDMKGLACVSGELSNAAKYFSSFANVSSTNMNTINGSVGKSGTWQKMGL